MSRISVIEEKVASASDGKSPASGSAPVDGATRDAVLKLRKLVAEIGDRVTRSENAIAKDKLDLLKLREVVGTALKKQKSEVETVMSSQESAKRKEEDSTKLLETLKERDRLVAAEVEVLRGKVEEMSKCLRESAEHRKVSESEISSRVRSIARRSENAEKQATELHEKVNPLLVAAAVSEANDRSSASHHGGHADPEEGGEGRRERRRESGKGSYGGQSRRDRPWRNTGAAGVPPSNRDDSPSPEVGKGERKGSEGEGPARCPYEAVMGEIHPNAVHICESCQADVCNQCYSSWDRMCLGCKRHGPRWRETHHFPNTAPAEEGGKGAPPRRCAMEGIQGNVHSTPHHECKKCEKVVCGPCYDGWSRMCVPCMMATDMCSYCGSEGLVDHCCRCRRLFCAEQLAGDLDIALAKKHMVSISGTRASVSRALRLASTNARRPSGMTPLPLPGEVVLLLAPAQADSNLPFAGNRPSTPSKGQGTPRSSGHGAAGPMGQSRAEDQPPSERSARTVPYADATNPTAGRPADGCGGNTFGSEQSLYWPVCRRQGSGILQS